MASCICCVCRRALLSDVDEELHKLLLLRENTVGGNGVVMVMCAQKQGLVRQQQPYGLHTNGGAERDEEEMHFTSWLSRKPRVSRTCV